VVEMERPYVVSFHGDVVGEYFADLVVERKVIVEVKAVQRLGVDHEAQLMNYLRLSGCQLGFLFNLGRMKVQFNRMVLEWGRGGGNLFQRVGGWAVGDGAYRLILW
jgi:GxxExxY protein